MARYRIAIAALALVTSFSAGEANAALISYWAADGNAVDSVGSNSGTLVDGADFAPGIFGQAFHFDGTSYVETPTNGMPTGNGDRTVDLWFNVSSYSESVEEEFLAGYGAFGSPGQTYEILVNHFDIGGPAGDRVVFSQWGQRLIGGPAIQPGTWHNLGVTNSGNFVTLYLDGTAVASGTLTIATPAGTSFFMGRVPGSLGDIRQLDGLVDEVRVYDTALSASEMQALATIPEPRTALLLATGVLGLAIGGARRDRC
jgi:hypothetical protein